MFLSGLESGHWLRVELMFPSQLSDHLVASSVGSQLPSSTRLCDLAIIRLITQAQVAVEYRCIARYGIAAGFDEDDPPRCEKRPLRR
jgi:hypothetical protein